MEGNNTPFPPTSPAEVAPPIPKPAQPVNQTPVKPSNFLVLLLSVLLVIAVAIAGFFYFQIQKLSKELSKYQTQTTPTPTASQAPNGDLTNWKTYTNTKYNYEFKYPSDFNLEKSTSGGYFQTKLNNRLIFYATNDQSSTIADYLVKADKISQSANEGLSSLQVQSTKKTVINGLNCIQREEYLTATDLTQINTYFKKGSVVVSIALEPTPGNPRSEDESLYQQILSTFRFLGQNSQTSSCTPKFKVESGPELTASEAYSQKCYEAKTKEECEKVDIYRESTQNFGNPDGIPDCNWTN